MWLSIREVGQQQFPGMDVKVKVLENTKCLSAEVWTRQPGKRRGKLSAIITYPTGNMYDPVIKVLK